MAETPIRIRRAQAQLRNAMRDLFGRDLTRLLLAKGAAALPQARSAEARLLAAACIERVRYPVAPQEWRNLQMGAAEALEELESYAGPEQIELFDVAAAMMMENDAAALSLHAAGVPVDLSQAFATDTAALDYGRQLLAHNSTLQPRDWGRAGELLTECIVTRRQLRTAVGRAGQIGPDPKLQGLRQVEERLLHLSGQAPLRPEAGRGTVTSLRPKGAPKPRG